jgi:phosphopantothenoylcysteine decarboxylase/phosphopantothenate--cysteine ligase
MWHNPATAHNIAVLEERGVTVIGPVSGQLTGADAGQGRMSEPEDIVTAALAVLREKDLAGRRIVITAGGTREALDPVRFIGNRSSGKQGVALACAAADRGATVTLIGANLEVTVPATIRVEHVTSTRELADAVFAAAEDADVVIMAAAVSDYRPETVAESKIKKETEGERLTIELVKNPDILVGLADRRRDGQIIVGFAAETEPDAAALLALGRAKIRKKGSDLLVLNRVGWTEGFATEANTVIVLDGAGDIVMEASGSKKSVADRILDVLV